MSDKQAHQQDWTTVTTNRKKNNDKNTQTQYIEIVNRSSSKGKSDQTTQIHPLNDTWVCWFHTLSDDKWDLPSYTQLFTFNTVEDFWILYNNIKNVNNGMYYIMREGYPPIWDHEKNVKGGGWTFKIDKKFANEFWQKLSCFCVGETVSKHPENIVGISVSPKIRFVTIRLWTKNIDNNPAEFIEIKTQTENDSLTINFENARFTPNAEAIC